LHPRWAVEWPSDWSSTLWIWRWSWQWNLNRIQRDKLAYW
jgi:hypothetical protein